MNKAPLKNRKKESQTKLMKLGTQLCPMTSTPKKPRKNNNTLAKNVVLSQQTKRPRQLRKTGNASPAPKSTGVVKATAAKSSGDTTSTQTTTEADTAQSTRKEGVDDALFEFLSIRASPQYEHPLNSSHLEFEQNLPAMQYDLLDAATLADDETSSIDSGLPAVNIDVPDDKK